VLRGLMLVLGGMVGALVVIRPTHDLFHWATLLPLLLLCVVGSVGHLLLIMAYARAPVATLTPFLYFQIAFAGVSGWLVFGHVPDLPAFAGMALIALCGSLGTWLAARTSHPPKATSR
jgi:drug/metabolite transporter (DMT)-like permease